MTTYRTLIRATLLATALFLAWPVASASAEAARSGHAVIGGIDLANGTVTLLGETFATSHLTKIVDERGGTLTLAELNAIQPSSGVPDPRTGDAVFFEATSTGEPRTLIELRRVKEMPR